MISLVLNQPEDVELLDEIISQNLLHTNFDAYNELVAHTNPKHTYPILNTERTATNLESLPDNVKQQLQPTQPSIYPEAEYGLHLGLQPTKNRLQKPNSYLTFDNIPLSTAYAADNLTGQRKKKTIRVF